MKDTFKQFKVFSNKIKIQKNKLSIKLIQTDYCKKIFLHTLKLCKIILEDHQKMR